MKLTVIPTPIGNLEDITLRALRLLEDADLILAEDTRTSSKLLKHYEISKPLKSHHKFNEYKTVEHIAEEILAGVKTVLISDAGTPGISDPGAMLVKACIQRDIEVECLPGPTAFVPALVVSGLNTEEFVFIGFLPQKKGKQSKIKSLAEEPRTMIFYESPYRVVKTLQAFKENFGAERLVSVSRELTKMYEETVRGTIEEVLNHFVVNEPRGEFVIVVEGCLCDKKKK